MCFASRYSYIIHRLVGLHCAPGERQAWAPCMLQPLQTHSCGRGSRGRGLEEQHEYYQSSAATEVGGWVGGGGEAKG